MKTQHLVWLPLLIALLSPLQADEQHLLAESIDIDKVPSWFPVGFALLTHENQQYVAYYNEKHQMIVASRTLGQGEWEKVELPSKIGWDSHNYITMALDATGCIHLAGNMHCVPLIYFRTEKPGDISTFRRHSMTGIEEKRCTYPRFLEDLEGHLLFTYRSGGSGNGKWLYNRYHLEKKSWSRFLDTPLFDGEGQRNAYPHGPTKGPDGLFHVVWVWRDTPDCATNHHLSYARSKDLQHWEAATGQAVKLPLTLGQTALCVDPIPPQGGIINGCEKLVFDAKNRPIISYHKLDGKGHMQIFVARLESGEWKRHSLTQWDKNIAFSGYGAMGFIGIKISELKRLDGETFYITYKHRDYGSGRIVVDEESLEPVDKEVKAPAAFPRELDRKEVAFKGIGIKRALDSGDSEETGVKYVLQWETLPPHQDRPRQPPLPPPSTLRLIKLVRAEKDSR